MAAVLYYIKSVLLACFLFLNSSTAAKIAALEAKLKQMEEEELGISAKRPKLSTQEQLTRARKKAGSKIQIIHRPSKKHRGRTV